MNKLEKIIFAASIVLTMVAGVSAQTKNFIPVDGASLRAAPAHRAAGSGWAISLKHDQEWPLTLK